MWNLTKNIFRLGSAAAGLVVYGAIVSGADEPASLHLNGSLTWSNTAPASEQRVEWTQDIVAGNWRSSWGELVELPPNAGIQSVPVPMYFRLASYPVATNLPGNASVLLIATNGVQTAFTNLVEAHSAATSGAHIFLMGGVYDVGVFSITNSNVTFVGPHEPEYDIASGAFKSGAIVDGRTQIGETKDLTFINLGFQDSGGNDVFTSLGTSTNERNLYMYGCVFAGTGGNAHNIEVIGCRVRLDRCSSFNGRHNFAFKTCRLTLSNIRSYNGSLNGIIIKSSAAIGPVFDAQLSDILIDGPVGGSSAKGLHIEGFSAGYEARNIRIHQLRTENVNIAVYINPHAGSVVKDVVVSDSESYNSYQIHGDYLLQPGASDVSFINCRSHDSTGKSFVNYGSSGVKLLNCFSTKPEADRTFGVFQVKQLNGQL